MLASLERGLAYAPRPGDHQLFRAIDRRHTHRADFATRPVPVSLLARLARETQQAGATLHLLTDDDNKREVATLLGQGDRTQFGDTGFRRELAAWVRPNRTRRSDGMPGYAFGISDLASVLGPTMIATFDTGARQARKDERPHPDRTRPVGSEHRRGHPLALAGRRAGGGAAPAARRGPRVGRVVPQPAHRGARPTTPAE